MTNLCPNCGFNGEYDEMIFDGSTVVACMMCENEPHPDIGEFTIEMRKIWGIPLYLPPIYQTMAEIWA